jgi:predicted Fe-Mo cluster-binding NifX family protein
MSRIAIATTDGITVNEHFGKASFFYVYDLSGDEYKFTEIRDAVAACQHARSHSETDFDRIIALLSDCDALFVQKIGEGAAAYLISKGVRVFEVSGGIKPLTDKIISDKII